MLIIADRIKETSTTTGAGALALAGAMTGFRRFSAVCSPGDTLYYAAQAVDGNGVPTGEWEVGLGTYSGVNTLTRTTPQASSNGGAAVDFAVGTKQVWLDLTASQLSGFAATAGTVPLAGSSVWAAIPAANTVPQGSLWFATDIGSAGQFFKSDGSTRWHPVGGAINAYTLPAPSSSLCTSETILGQYLIPANLLQVGDTLRIWVSLGKSGTTNTLDTRIRIGTLGTVSDTIITGTSGVNLLAANRSRGDIYDLSLVSATSIKKVGSSAVAGSYSGVNTTAPPAATAIASAAANALYVSYTGLSNGSTDTMSLEDFKVQIVSKA